jgi:hypothetical protein
MSIRVKILLIVFGFFALTGIVFALYSNATIKSYRLLRIDGISKTIAFESEIVGNIISEIERGTMTFAFISEQTYRSGRSFDIPENITSLENISIKTALNIGIWFEPFVLENNNQRICFNFIFDQESRAIIFDRVFEDENNKYSLDWYSGIIAGLEDKNRNIIWSFPY